MDRSLSFLDAPISLGLKVASRRKLSLMARLGSESQMYGPIPSAYLLHIPAAQLPGINLCVSSRILAPHRVLGIRQALDMY